MKPFRFALVFLLILLALGDLFLRVSGLPSADKPMSQDAYISIMITTLGVIVAVFAVLVALAAIWGYSGLKERVHDMAKTQVKEALDEAMAKYPQAPEVFRALAELKQHSDLLAEMQSQIPPHPEKRIPVPVATSDDNVSNDNAQAPQTPLERIEGQITPIEPYPGEGKDDANDDN